VSVNPEIDNHGLGKPGWI